MKIILASASLGRKKILTDLGLKFTVMPAKIDERKITASCRRHSLWRRTANPIKLVKKIAKAKAEAAYDRLFKNNGAGSLTNFRGTKRSRRNVGRVPAGFCTAENFRQATKAPTIIIAADSMILFKGKTYGKPKDKNEAGKFLMMLSGQTHEFLTGVCVIKLTINPRHCEERAKRLTRQSQTRLLRRSTSRNDEVIYQKSCKSRVYFEKFTPKEINDYVRIAEVTSFAGGFAPDLKGGEIIKAKMKIKGSVSNVLGGLPLEILLPILKENGVKI